jgi:sulfate adenylyltransferase
VDLLVDDDRAAELSAHAIEWPSWCLSRRQLCDLELLACGGFTPLETFLDRADYESVCATMRLADQTTLWPIPVTLDLPGDVLAAAQRAGYLALRDSEGVMLAALRIHDAWRPDVQAEAAAVFGTCDEAHPGVEHLLHRTHRWYVTGDLEVLRLPDHSDFDGLRRAPEQVRAEFARRGWNRVVAFQTRNPMHRAHQQLTLRAAQQADANLLIHPVVGIGKPGDWPLPGALRVATAHYCQPIRRIRRFCRCCHSRCGWVVRAKRSGTRSSVATTEQRTSSLGAITPAQASTPSPTFIARTRHKNSSQLTATKSA